MNDLKCPHFLINYLECQRVFSGSSKTPSNRNFNHENSLLTSPNPRLSVSDVECNLLKTENEFTRIHQNKDSSNSSQIRRSLESFPLDKNGDCIAKGQFSDFSASNALSKLTIQTHIPIISSTKKDASIGSCDAVKSMRRTRPRALLSRIQNDEKSLNLCSSFALRGCKRTHSHSSSQELTNDAEMTSPKTITVRPRHKPVRNRSFNFPNRTSFNNNIEFDPDSPLDSASTSHYCESANNLDSLSHFDFPTTYDVERMSTADDNATIHSFRPQTSSISDDNSSPIVIRRHHRKSKSKSGLFLREHMIVSSMLSRQFRTSRTKKSNRERYSNNDSSDGKPHRCKLPRIAANNHPFVANNSCNRKRATVYGNSNPIRPRQLNKRRTIPICSMDIDPASVKSYSSSSESSFPSESDQDDQPISPAGRDGDDEESDYPGTEPQRPPFLVRRALIHLRKPILSSTFMLSTKRNPMPTSTTFFQENLSLSDPASTSACANLDM